MLVCIYLPSISSRFQRKKMIRVRRLKRSKNRTFFGVVVWSAASNPPSRCGRVRPLSKTGFICSLVEHSFGISHSWLCSTARMASFAYPASILFVIIGDPFARISCAPYASWKLEDNWEPVARFSIFNCIPVASRVIWGAHRRIHDSFRGVALQSVFPRSL